MPERIILECDKELQAFRGVVCELDMPTIDLEAALSQVFDTVQNLQQFENKICYLASDMSRGEALFENSDLQGDAYDRIHEAVVNLGEGIKNKLVNLKAYQDNGNFPYSFRKMIDDNTILLSAVRFETAAATTNPA